MFCFDEIVSSSIVFGLEHPLFFGVFDSDSNPFMCVSVVGAVMKSAQNPLTYICWCRWYVLKLYIYIYIYIYIFIFIFILFFILGSNRSRLLRLDRVPEVQCF